MEIRKINGIRPEDAAAVDRAFEGIEPCRIACCNWAEEYPYAPEVTFRMFHTGDYLMLPLKSATNKYSLNLVYKDTKFRLSKMGKTASAWGAAMLIRNQVLGLC